MAAHEPAKIIKEHRTKTQTQMGRPLQSVWNKMRKQMWLEDPRCKMCGCITVFPMGFHLDHIRPLHLGGGNNKENLQILCVPCHRDKTREENKAIRGE